jgi:ankyrin repeat protein
MESRTDVLHRLIRRNDLAAITEFWDHRDLLADEWDSDDSLLHLAARVDGVEMCGFLLDRGVYINKRSFQSRTPLFDAIYRGSVNAVRYLLQRGADHSLVDASDYTPFDVACYVQSAPCASVLWEHGARPGKTYRTLFRPYTPSFLSLILALGVDVNVIDRVGFTPLQRSHGYGDAQRCSILMRYTKMSGFPPFCGSWDILTHYYTNRVITRIRLLAWAFCHPGNLPFFCLDIVRYVGEFV